MPLTTRAIRVAEARKKKSTSVSSNAMAGNVLPPSLDWPMIWTLREFARRLKRIFRATVPYKKMKKWERSFNYLAIKERMLRTFWWTKKFVIPKMSFCTVSKRAVQMHSTICAGEKTVNATVSVGHGPVVYTWLVWRSEL